MSARSHKIRVGQVEIYAEDKGARKSGCGVDVRGSVLRCCADQGTCRVLSRPSR